MSYPYRVWMDQTFSYSPEAKRTVLSTCYYTPETPGLEQINEKKASCKSAYAHRKTLFTQNKPIPFLTDIHCEMFHTQRLGMPGLNLRLKFLPNEVDFPIISASKNAGTFRLELLNAKLTYRLISVSPNILPSILSRMEKNALVKYPFVQTVIRTEPIGVGKTFYPFNFLFSGPLPSQVSR